MCIYLSVVDFASHSTKLMIVRLDCIRKRVSRAAKRDFSGPSIQQVGTYVQQAHSSKSIKGKSRSVSKQRTKPHIVDDNTTSCNNQGNKVYTPRPICKDVACTFNFTIFCNKSDQGWYLSYSSGHNKCSPYHKHHLPINIEHISISLRHLPPAIDTFIIHLLNERVPPSTITKLVSQHYGKTISEQSVFKQRDNISYSLLKETSDLPYGTPVERLIAEFSMKSDVSFMYVTHDIDSGFVTHQKRKHDSRSKEIALEEDFIKVYQDDIESWRKLLKVGDSQQILVAFAWCHDEELRRAKMFPEFLACDTTFGVTKEQRNLFLFAGIDGNNKVFTAFRCFMPSKETRAYNWALRVAFRHLLGDSILSYNQCIASDQELAMYQPIRAMIGAVTCLNKSRHRLDKYHLLKKEWLDKVSLKVSGEEATTIIDILLGMLTDLFDYVETEDEMKLTIKHFKRYYAKVKSQLKSEYVQQEVEAIALSIETNLSFICNCYFKDVTTFGFLGDSIVEAANSGLKSGGVNVSTNMTINNSGSAQLKITENQAQRKNK